MAFNKGTGPGSVSNSIHLGMGMALAPANDGHNKNNSFNQITQLQNQLNVMDLKLPHMRIRKNRQLSSSIKYSSQKNVTDESYQDLEIVPQSKQTFNLRTSLASTSVRQPQCSDILKQAPFNRKQYSQQQKKPIICVYIQ